MTDPLTAALLLAAGAGVAIAWRTSRDAAKRMDAIEAANRKLLASTSSIEAKQGEVTSRLYAHNEELQQLCVRASVKRYGAK